MVEPADKPTPRVFRGYVQRVGDFSSDARLLRAVELSIAAPIGLSGGPVFVPSSDRVFAVVTGNFESYTTLDEEVEQIAPEQTRTTTARRIVSYGMALSLWHVEEWLREVAPLAGNARW